MRTFTFFNQIDASQPAISPVFTVDCGMEMQYVITAVKNGVDGSPLMTIEMGGEEFTPVMNLDKNGVFTYYELDDTPYSVVSDTFEGTLIRINYEPNGVTAGEVTITMKYKTRT